MPQRSQPHGATASRACGRLPPEKSMIDPRGRLLLVALEAARVNAELPVLAALRSWLDSWRGIGAVELGMAFVRPGGAAHGTRSARIFAVRTSRSSGSPG